jgi:hypothetical protein
VALVNQVELALDNDEETVGEHICEYIYTFILIHDMRDDNSKADLTYKSIHTYVHIHLYLYVYIQGMAARLICC